MYIRNLLRVIILIVDRSTKALTVSQNKVIFLYSKKHLHLPI